MEVMPFGKYGFGIGITVISIMLLIGGIILGVGYALDDKKFKDFGKQEIYQSIVNGVILGSLILLFLPNGIISDIVNYAVSSNNASYSCPGFMAQNSGICFAYNYLVGTAQYKFNSISYPSLSEITGSMLASFSALAIFLGIISGTTINLIVVSFSPSSMIMPFLHQVQYIIEILSASLIGIYVQASILSFVAITAISVLLPLGIILRTFFPTRKLGGFIMAVAIALYVVFPLSYLIDATLMQSYYSQYSQNSFQQIEVQAQSLNSQYLGSIPSSVNSTSFNVADISGAASSLLNSLANIMQSLLFLLSGLIVQIFILPVFSIVLTGISIKELSGILGAEASFGKLRIFT
jgi:hypothetical protein